MPIDILSNCYIINIIIAGITILTMKVCFFIQL